MLYWPQIQPFTQQQLESITTPAWVPGGNREGYNRCYYSSRTYVAAGSAELDFFQTVENDKSLSNMEAPGQMADPKYFRINSIHCQPLLAESSLTVPLAWRDMLRLILIGRPILTLFIQDKTYAQIPLAHCTAAGGLTGQGYSDGAGAGVVSHEYANNGQPTGGWKVGGGLWLKPKVNFVVSIRWGNPLAVAADTIIRTELVGTEYRAIN